MSRRHVWLALGLLPLAAMEANAKAPGTTYCFREVCHRVKTIPETARDIGTPRDLIASHYDAPWRDPFNPSLTTSSGETLNPDEADTAASPTYPDGTRLLVFSPSSGGAAVVRVNNAGPYWGKRELDVSRGVAEKLGFAKTGVIRLMTVVVAAPTRAEAAYERDRVYTPVPGYLGDFSSLDEARRAWDGLPQAMIAASTPSALDEPEGEPAPERVVIIEDKAAAESASSDGETSAKPRDKDGAGKKIAAEKKSGASVKGRVVLKPVKLRRPAMLAKLTKGARTAEVARKAATSAAKSSKQ